MKSEMRDLLTNALRERFKANATLNAIRKEIEGIVEQKTRNKYESDPFLKDGMEFELLGVKVNCWISERALSIEGTDVSITLAYVCSSKLPKAKREALEEAKSGYAIRKYIGENRYKYPIWHELRYEVDIEMALAGAINLKIE